MSDSNEQDRGPHYAQPDAAGEDRRNRRAAMPIRSLIRFGQEASPLFAALNHYGPTAFGLVCFLAIWFSAVRPTLENNRIDYHANQQIVDTMRQTAQTLSNIVDRLERLERRLSP